MGPRSQRGLSETQTGPAYTKNPSVACYYTQRYCSTFLLQIKPYSGNEYGKLVTQVEGDRPQVLPLRSSRKRGSLATAEWSLCLLTRRIGPSAVWSLPFAPAHLLPLIALHLTLSIHDLLSSLYKSPDFCLHSFAHAVPSTSTSLPQLTHLLRLSLGFTFSRNSSLTLSSLFSNSSFTFLSPPLVYEVSECRRCVFPVSIVGRLGKWKNSICFR